jgi:hypothetical protein
MAPLFIFGLGPAVGLFIAVFALCLVGILGYFAWARYRGSDPWDDFAAAAATIVDAEDADAIALLPYSDGPIIPKPAIYDRDLLGGVGGYRTPDGDRIYVDGQGNGTYSLEGIDCVLGIDPTEHAAAADPLKAWVSHKTNIGEWIKVDREGNLIEAGEAVENLDDTTPAMDQPLGNGAGPSATGDAAAATDGGHPSLVHEHAAENDIEDLAEAKAQLEEAGLLHKLVDIAPPREANVEDGELQVEEASHVAVDVSAAADLLPKKTNTTEWQTMEEKARQEGRDQDKIREHIMMGFVMGGATAGITAIVLAVVMGFL